MNMNWYVFFVSIGSAFAVFAALVGVIAFIENRRGVRFRKSQADIEAKIKAYVQQKA